MAVRSSNGTGPLAVGEPSRGKGGRLEGEGQAAKDALPAAEGAARQAEQAAAVAELHAGAARLRAGQAEQQTGTAGRQLERAGDAAVAAVRTAGQADVLLLDTQARRLAAQVGEGQPFGVPGARAGRRSDLHRGFSVTAGALLAVLGGFALYTVRHELVLLLVAAFIATGWTRRCAGWCAAACPVRWPSLSSR